jgi:hypothetical protein
MGQRAGAEPLELARGYGWAGRRAWATRRDTGRSWCRPRRSVIARLWGPVLVSVNSEWGRCPALTGWVWHRGPAAPAFWQLLLGAAPTIPLPELPSLGPAVALAALRRGLEEAVSGWWCAGFEIESGLLPRPQSRLLRSQPHLPLQKFCRSLLGSKDTIRSVGTVVAGCRIGVALLKTSPTGLLNRSEFQLPANLTRTSSARSSPQPMNRMGYPPPQFGDTPGGDRNTPYPQQWIQPSSPDSPPVTMVSTVALPVQTVTNSGAGRETTQYITYATTYMISSSADAKTTSTDAALPFRQDAQSGLQGGRLAAAVCFPIASVFVLFLAGLFLLRRRRQKRKARETPGEMANVTGLSPQLPLPKVSDCPPKDDYLAPGLPPTDLERPSPVAFPGEQSENGPGRRPFSYAGYFSGIDTSAAESQHSPVNGLSYRSMNPEPPPPYAPPPHESMISPSNSVRLAHPRPISVAYSLSQTGMPLHGSPEIRSPFADPVDDNAESRAPSVDRNEVIGRRGTDNVSVASDISDRDREASVHQMV